MIQDSKTGVVCTPLGSEVTRKRTPLVPTRRKGGCVERKGGKKRASGCIGFRGKRNSGLEAGFD